MVHEGNCIVIQINPNKIPLTFYNLLRPRPNADILYGRRHTGHITQSSPNNDPATIACDDLPATQANKRPLAQLKPIPGDINRFSSDVSSLSHHIDSCLNCYSRLTRRLRCFSCAVGTVPGTDRQIQRSTCEHRSGQYRQCRCRCRRPLRHGLPHTWHLPPPSHTNMSQHPMNNLPLFWWAPEKVRHGPSARRGVVRLAAAVQGRLPNMALRVKAAQTRTDCCPNSGAAPASAQTAARWCWPRRTAARRPRR